MAIKERAPSSPGMLASATRYWQPLSPASSSISLQYHLPQYPTKPNQNKFKMAGFTSTQTFTNSGRGGYNGPAASSNSDDESRTLVFMSSVRGACIKRSDDDDENEDGRGGYN
ncbi:hypothetical protein VTL71DRAFT_15840, partial [Oculimacula yallundae]